MTEDRQKTIVAASNLGDDELGAAFLHHRSRLSNLIMVGNLLVIDETILASNSRQAKRDGMLVFVPGKPHLKGFFVHMAVQKLLYSSLPLVLDVECKWSYESLNKNRALLAMTGRLEDQFKMPFIVWQTQDFPPQAS
jgi:hypothetical protein